MRWWLCDLLQARETLSTDVTVSKWWLRAVSVFEFLNNILRHSRLELAVFKYSADLGISTGITSAHIKRCPSVPSTRSFLSYTHLQPLFQLITATNMLNHQYSVNRPRQGSYGYEQQSQYGSYGGGLQHSRSYRGPPPGADPQLWQWFSSVDTDRSGSITATELQAALVNGMLPISIREVMHILTFTFTKGIGRVRSLIGTKKYSKSW